LIFRKEVTVEMTLVISIKKEQLQETFSLLSKFPINQKIESILYEPQFYPLVLVKNDIVVVYHENDLIFSKINEHWKAYSILRLEDIKEERNYLALVSLNIFNSWAPILRRVNLNFISKNVYSEAGIEVFPSYQDTFRLFSILPLEKVKVVFIFQDPYQHKHACGIAVSTHEPKIPPTLATLLKVLKREGFKNDEKRKEPGNLLPWVNQGVFLFNTALTVGKGEGRNHYSYWEPLTREVCSELNKNGKLIVCLFGKKAQELKGYLKGTEILLFAHPSPNSLVSFDNVVIFSEVNRKLKEKKVEEINWNLE
jgi:uracil-DNA glycosylase